jgi:hypothetical protein
VRERHRAAVTAVFAVNGAAFASLFSRLPELQRQHGLGDGALGLVLLASLVGYLIVLHVQSYRSIMSGSTDLVITGRYLIPFVILLGAMVAVTISWLPRRFAPVATAIVVFASLALHLSSFGATVVRFHG